MPPPNYNKLVKTLGLKTITGKELESLCKMGNKKMRASMLEDLAAKEKAFKKAKDLEKALQDLMLF